MLGLGSSKYLLVKEGVSIVISVNFLQPVQQLALAPIHFKGVFTPRLFGAVDLKPG